MTQDCLPEEDNWDALVDFEFISVQLLYVSQYREKTQFRTNAMQAGKRRMNVEREKNKKQRTDALSGAVMGEMFNPHVDQGRANIRYVCKELIKHPTVNSDLVV